MSAADRAKSPGRIAAVQAEMVKLAEWRLTAAERRRAGLDEERRALASLVGGEEALSATLAKAALRTSKAIDGRLSEVERDLVALNTDLARLRRRDRVVRDLAQEASTAARRADEAKALGETMEVWLARASLP